jgi:hypothetical protein
MYCSTISDIVGMKDDARIHISSIFDFIETKNHPFTPSVSTPLSRKKAGSYQVKKVYNNSERSYFRRDE